MKKTFLLVQEKATTGSIYQLHSARISYKYVILYADCLAGDGEIMKKEFFDMEKQEAVNPLVFVSSIVFLIIFELPLS